MTVSNNKELLLEVNHLGVSFKIKNEKSLFFAKPQTLKAVKDVSFKLYAGETLGVVGESGCGKSTLARAIIGLVEASEGEILWLGKNLRKQSAKQWKETRKDIQMIFQDPLASLNPRMNIGEIIAEPLKIYQPHLSAVEVKEKVQAMMLKVGLLPNLINRYPHEFSGGQCQRIGIARALTMELGSDEEVYNNTKHPYTKALMSAVPIPDPKLERNKSIELLEGDLPSPINPPSGCVFRTRCLKADENCAKQKPSFTSQNNSHFVACLKVL